MTRPTMAKLLTACACVLALGIGVLIHVRAPSPPATVLANTPLDASAACSLVGYSRTAFGNEPSKATRKRIKARDAVAGQLVDYYTGEPLLAGDKPQADHVVALADAWRSGACKWASQVRKRFASDTATQRFELRYTSAHLNESKSDQSPKDWSPAKRDFACRYGQDYLAIKAEWSLTVATEDRDAVALACGTEATQ